MTAVGTSRTWHDVRLVSAKRAKADIVKGRAGNLPPPPGVFPDTLAPVIRTTLTGERKR